MKAKQRGLGILLNYLTEGVRVVTALLFTPVLLRLLGQEEYGLYQLAGSVVSCLSLLNLGFGSGYVRYFARYQVRGAEEEIARLNGMFAVIFGVLAAVSLVCGTLLTIHAEKLFGSGLTTGELEKAGRLLGILTVNLALTLLNSLFDCYITARECFVFQRLLRLLQAVCSPFLTLPLLLLGCGSEALAVVSLALTAVALAGNGLYCRRKLKMAVSFRDLPFSRLKELWNFTFFIFLNQLIDQANWSVDKFLLGRLQGTEAVAVYGVAAQIHSLYLQLSTAISAVFVPMVNRLAAQSPDNRELSRLFAGVGQMQAAVLGLVLSGFALFGKSFLNLWAGTQYEDAYFVALLLMVPVTIPLMQNLGIEIQRSRNAHRTRSLVYGCLAAGNVLLSTVWIPRWGAVGAAAGTAVSVLLGNGLFMNWYYGKRFALDMGAFWRGIGAFLPGWAAAVGFGTLLRRTMDTADWGGLMRAVLLYSAGYAIALLPLWKKKRGQANGLSPWELTR